MKPNIKRALPEQQEKNQETWEDIINSQQNQQIRMEIFKIVYYQKMIYDKNILPLIDLMLYCDRDTQEFQQNMQEPKQNKFAILEDFKRWNDGFKFNHNIPSTYQKQKFFDCFKNQHNQHKQLCETGEKICLYENCNLDRVICQKCLKNHQGCNKIILIDDIINLILTADKKVQISNQDIHLLINPKLPYELKAQILTMYFTIQKSPNKPIIPKDQQDIFLQKLTILNHQIQLVNSQLQQPYQEINPKPVQVDESQLIQDSTDTDQSQVECQHPNKNSIQICFYFNIDPIYCDRCNQLHVDHKSQSLKQFKEVVQICNTNGQNLDALIQTCKFLQIYLQIRSNDNLSVNDARKIKNLAKQQMSGSNLLKVDFQTILNSFQKLSFNEQTQDTLKEKDRIIQELQSQMKELQKKYDQTSELRSQNETLKNQIKIASKKLNDEQERTKMLEKDKTQLMQENQQMKKSESTNQLKQMQKDDQEQLKLKLQDQQKLCTEYQNQIQVLKSENEGLKQQFEVDILKTLQKEKKKIQEQSQQIESLKQEKDKVIQQLEKQTKNGPQQVHIKQQEKQKSEAQVNQLQVNELIIQINDSPFYKSKKCECGRNFITSICYSDQYENKLLCDQCSQNIKKECILYSFEENSEQVKQNHRFDKFHQMILLQKQLQEQNLFLFDPYQYLSAQRILNNQQLFKMAQLVLTKDLLNVKFNNSTNKLQEYLDKFFDQFIHFQRQSVEFSNYFANEVKTVMEVICTPQKLMGLDEGSINQQLKKLELGRTKLELAEKVLQQYTVDIQNNQEKLLYSQQISELQCFNKYFANFNNKKVLFILQERNFNAQQLFQLNHALRLDIKVDKEFKFYGLYISNLLENQNADIDIYIYSLNEGKTVKQYSECLKIIQCHELRLLKILISKPQQFQFSQQIAIFLNMKQQCSYQTYKKSIQNNNYFTIQNDPQFKVDSFIKIIPQKIEEGVITSLIVGDD